MAEDLKPAIPLGNDAIPLASEDVVISNVTRSADGTVTPIGTITTNPNGNMEITGEPNVEELKKALKKYEASQISKGKLKRPWYRPTAADMRKNVRNYGPTLCSAIFSAIAAFK